MAASRTGVPDPLNLPSKAAPKDGIRIDKFSYLAELGSGWSVPTVAPGESLAFKNIDAQQSVNAFHTITSCKLPCNGRTGVAYPLANGPVSFDSGELGFNGQNGGLPGAPAADRDKWLTPKDLAPGTYTYFCRIHPFMRGTFRVGYVCPTKKSVKKARKAVRRASRAMKRVKRSDAPAAKLHKAQHKLKKKRKQLRKMKSKRRTCLKRQASLG